MRLAFLSDIHFGKDEDLRAYRFAVSILKTLNLDKVFLGGDIFDHAAVSRYKKSLEVEGTLQEELDHGFVQLSRLRSAIPVETHFLPGNHEKRLVDYLSNNARAIGGLRALAYEKVYRLDELDIKFHPEGHPVKFGHLWLAHGHEFASGGQNPARTALNNVNSNVLFGHIHKQSVANKTDLSGKTLVAYSNPCLSTMSPDYTLKPDWVQGFSVAEFTKSGYFAITQYTFWRHEGRLHCLVGSKLHKERKHRGR
jgi:predicted phosphodiesterase